MSWLLSCLLPCQKQRDDYRSGISEEKRPYEGLPQAVRRISICLRFPVALNLALNRVPNKARAIPHNSKCRYGERGAADAKPKAQIILDVLSSILANRSRCRVPRLCSRSDVRNPTRRELCGVAKCGVAQDKRAVYSYAALFHTTKCPRTRHRYIVHENIF